MYKKLLPLIIFSIFICHQANAHVHLGQKAFSKIINNNGEEIGIARYTQGTEGILIEIDVSNLPAGKHGMHFHEVGTCEDHEHFKKAGGHIMPTGKPHGFFHPQGPHEGNLPNLIVDKYGHAHVELYSDLVSINGAFGKPALLDGDGSTLMIHINEDDHLSQPIGNSGARIACGVVTASD